MIANVCKHHVTKIPYRNRAARAGFGGRHGRHDAFGKRFSERRSRALLEKYLKGRADVPTENRVRILRLIENMTLGRNAVGYLTESMHGAGSPQAQRIQIARQMQIEFKKNLAKELAGIEPRKREQLTSEISDYFGKVFDTNV